MYTPTKSDIANEGAYLAHGLRVVGAGRNSIRRLFHSIPCGHEQEVDVGCAKSGKFRCQICQSINWQQEASSVGLTFLEKLGGHYASYRFNDCGHEQEIQTGAVRDGRFRCQTCLSQKYHKEAEAAGLTLHETFFKNNQTRGKYTFNDCGHEKEVGVNDVRKGRFHCQICQIKKWKDDAIDNGLTFLEKIPGANAKYRFNNCGHEQEIGVKEVRKGNFRCRQCADNKLQDEATAAGLKFVRKIDGHNAIYMFNKCKHEQQIDFGAVRAGRFQCRTCEETWAIRPSNLYLHIIEYGDTKLLKFGRARDVERRAVQYGLPVGAALEILKVWPTETGLEANRIETLVASNFKRYSKSKAKQVLSDSGWTECFHVEDKDKIVDFVDMQDISSCAVV